MELRRGILLVIVGGVLSAADSPFIGKWKLNTAKSQFAGTTTTYEKLPTGEMTETSGGQTYKFKLDGKEYPGPFGSKVIWKQIDANTYESIWKDPGMDTTNSYKISADGKTLTTVSKGKKPNGENMETSSTSQRVSGGPGLAGKWKSTEVKPANEMWDIKANGADGLLMSIVDYQVSAALKFDGRDITPTGPTIPKGFTLSIRKTGPNSLEMTEKIEGKPIFMDAMTVSADGKTLTSDSWAPGSTEKVKSVYEKQ